MEMRWDRSSTEEWILTFFEAEKEFMSLFVYPIGDEEAEVRIQDIVSAGTKKKSAKTQEKIISKVSRCICECFLQLWNEGFSEIIIIEDKKSEYAEILDSTPVVDVVYSEYMMEKESESGETTSSRAGEDFLLFHTEEETIVCKNREETFFCRLMRHKEEYYLYEVRVEEAVRNRGIAYACLTELFRRIRGKICLQVGSYNEPAVHLYQKLGFRITEELCCYAAVEEYFPEDETE